MRTRSRTMLAASIAIAAWPAQAVEPLPKAHAHNDYEHDRPLLDALGHGWRVRVWAAPDTPGPARKAVWTVLRDADADLINTDELSGLQAFLSE